MLSTRSEDGIRSQRRPYADANRHRPEVFANSAAKQKGSSLRQPNSPDIWNAERFLADRKVRLADQVVSEPMIDIAHVVHVNADSPEARIHQSRR